jgi:hypothetical protein
MFKKILKAIRKPKYYHEQYGIYTILKIWMRTDYNQKDALILTDNGFWHKVPYEWLICNSIAVK